MIKALVFDRESFFQLSRCAVADDWFNEYEIPEELTSVSRVELNGVLYFLRDEISDPSTPIIFVDLIPPNGIFQHDALDKYILDRMLTVARSLFTSSVAIPFNWHRHDEESLHSVFATSKSIGGGTLIHFETSPAGNPDLVFFARVEGNIAFRDLVTPDDLYLEARDLIAAAIKARPERKPARTKSTGITLSHRLPQSFSRGFSLSQWYETKLTAQQRAFVDKPYDGPVRLRGAAGTGKTLSLAIKFLRDACQFEEIRVGRRLCFLTHSAGTVDLVLGICLELDPIGLITGHGKYVQLQVRTLYDLAYEYLRFDVDKLNPLSLDGREGRQLQAELIGMALDLLRKELSFARFSDISENLRRGWTEQKGAPDREKLVTELMNEFASVLDADSVWAGTEKGDKYAKGHFGYRPVWLMNLPTERDRRFVLEVHRKYRKLLADMDTLSVDQMVADFNSFLDRNTWDMLKKSKGFDGVFVDELHLFTSIERQVLHKLIRNTVGDDGAISRPAIFMAYDVKQSPTDSFTQIGDRDASLFSSTTQLQNSELVKLSKVFRYTPQISEFLYDLDATFPAIDLAGEWESYAVTTESDKGERPSLTIFKNDAELFKSVFDESTQKARRLSGGKRVAVLCLNDSLFDQYSSIIDKRYDGRITKLDSREPTLAFTACG